MMMTMRRRMKAVSTHKWVERCWSMKKVFTQKWNNFPLDTYRGLVQHCKDWSGIDLFCKIAYLPIMFMMSSLIFCVKSILTSPTISKGFWW